MQHYQANKKNSPKRLYSKLILLAMLLVVLFLSKSVWDLSQKNKISRLNSQRSKETLESLEQRQKMLQENINKLQTVVGIDEEIRKNFNVVKEGEKVITIVDDKSATTTTASSTEVGFWQWLFRPKTNN